MNLLPIDKVVYLQGVENSFQQLFHCGALGAGTLTLGECSGLIQLKQRYRILFDNSLELRAFKGRKGADYPTQPMIHFET